MKKNIDLKTTIILLEKTKYQIKILDLKIIKILKQKEDISIEDRKKLNQIKQIRHIKEYEYSLLYNYAWKLIILKTKDKAWLCAIPKVHINYLNID